LQRYVISGGRTGYDRLKVLARVRWPETGKLLERVGVATGARCVDLGCGGGDVTLELARIVGPEGRVLGVDMDEVKLELARDAAQEQGLANVEFAVADVLDWHDEDAYDLVYSRFLLEHLRDPTDLLRRMWAAVRAGGALAVEDADFDGVFCYPPNDGFAFWEHISHAVLEHNGGDPRIGRKLFRYFVETGIRNPHVTLTQDANASGEAKTLSWLTVDAMSEAIVAAGLATSDEIASAVTSLSAFTEDPTTVVAGPRVFQVWARRD
jgi:ubiquinone/menaquinone biosynthesis C-methylase UbiE